MSTKAVGVVISRKDGNLVGFVFNVGGKVFAENLSAALKRMQSGCTNFESDGKKVVRGKGNNKISNLTAYTEDMVKFNNNMRIDAVIVGDDGEKVGFVVDCGLSDEGKRIKYSDLIRYSMWFKPVNYVIRTSSKGTAYVAGKVGFQKLEELPTIKGVSAGKISKNTAARVVSTPTDGNKATTVSNATKVSENKPDLLSVIEKVKDVKGILLKFPDTKYEATNKSDDTGVFFPLDTCQIADPYMQFGLSGANVNLGFKELGTVRVGPYMIYAYRYKTKTIIKNGESNISNIGVALSDKAADELKQFFITHGGEVCIEEFTDKSTVDRVQSLSGKSGLKLYRVFLDGVKVFPTRGIREYIMPHNKLEKCVRMLDIILATNKGIGGAIKELGISKKKPGEVAPMLKAFSSDVLEMIESAGIDTATGCYNGRSEGSSGSKNSDDTAIKIEYACSDSGFSSTVRAYDIAFGADNVKDTEMYGACLKYLNTDKSNIIDYVIDVGEDAIREKLLEIDRDASNIKRAIWMHNNALLQIGRYAGIYVGCSGDWSPENTRSKKALRYRSNTAKSLTVDVTNVTLG